MIKTTSIDSLTNFQKNAKAFVGKLEESKEPIVLTVNGKAKLVIQDAEAYQKMVDDIEEARLIEGIRVGIRQSEQGLSRPAEEVFAEMKAKYGF